ncbi:MAG: response regulator [Desulfatiglans sp.]|nr:response regulator [Thermodesulfobacteriota bacterium]MEE4352366.1 response regulator [Desulfatiglans sp.]
MSKLNILVVDDDRDFAESLADVLEMEGHGVEIAFRGEDAVKIFKERDFDITFMDVKLPGKNGVESLMDIRRIKENARVVMMTGYSVEQLLDQATENGAWGVFHKPVDIEEVIKMLNRVKTGGILIADDDPDFIEGLKDLLENGGYSVFVAANGMEVIERVKSKRIDVLILDLRMPILNGLETYTELRSQGYNIPTIIVTAYAREERDVLDTLHSLSVTGILSKPFNPEDLIKSVESIVRGD